MLHENFFFIFKFQFQNYVFDHTLVNVIFVMIGCFFNNKIMRTKTIKRNSSLSMVKTEHVFKFICE